MKKFVTPLVFLALAAMAYAAIVKEPATSPDWMAYPPCESDDGMEGPCLWLADVMGNGEGNSYWVDDSDQIHYID